MNTFYNNIKNRLRKYDFFESFRHTIWYFGAELLVQGLGLVSIMVYTYFLTEEEYGIVQIFLNTSNLLFVLMTMNFHVAIARYYYEEKDDYRSFNGLVLLSSLVLWAIASVFILLQQDYFAELINMPVEVIPWMVVLVLGIIFWRFFDYFFVAITESRSVSFSKVAVAYGRFGLSVTLFYVMAENYYAKIVADVGVILILLAYFLYKIWPHIQFEIKKEHIKYMLLISLPLLPHATSSFILSFFDQIMINVQLGREEAGLYSFAYKIGLLMSGFGMALYAATMPNFFQMMNRGETENVDSQVRSFYKFLTIAGGFLLLFAKEIGSVLAMSDGFLVALPLVPIIVLGYYFFCFYLIHSRIIIYSKRMIYLTILTLTAGALNIVLNYYVIPIYGSEGAAYSTLFTFAFLFVTSWLFCKYIIKIYMPPSRFILEYFAYMLVVILGNYGINYFIPQPIWLNILAKFGLFLILTWMLFGDKIKTALGR